MRPRRTLPAAVRNRDDLLTALRSAGLVSARRLAGLAARWAEDADPRCCALELVSAGLLTAYQAEQVLAGRGRRLRRGPYVIQEPLGAGGMGRVYRARHRVLKRTVALKVVALPRGGRRGGAVLAGFRHEAEAAARLRHPNIVTAYDADVAGGALYLAMEYLEGTDLERLVLAEGPLAVPLACEVVRQTALALAHAHGHGLIHHDVKPANLFLQTGPSGTGTGTGTGKTPLPVPVPDASSQSFPRVKLLDLGLARRIDADGEGPGEALHGTPDFMAPERGHEGGQADPRSDLYSLGCTFYFLLSGEVPYPGGSWTEKLLRHRLDEPPDVRELRPQVPDAVAAVVARLMARDAEARYPSAAALAEELARITGADAPAPQEEEVAAPAPPRTRPPLAAGITAAVLTGLLVAWWARWFLSAPPPSPARHVSPAPRNLPPFRVGGQAFAGLAEAVEAAPDGALVTIHGPGPFRVGPLAWRGKSLVLRAAAGVRPCLQWEASSAGPGEALLSTDRPLLLQGLELKAGPGKGQKPLVRVDGAALRLMDCRLHGPSGGVAVVCQGDVEARCCRIEGGSSGLSVEAGGGPCRIHLSETTVRVRETSGAGLSLCAAAGAGRASLDVYLEHCTVRAGRVLEARAVPGTLAVQARANHLDFREAILAYAGYPADGDGRLATTWRGRDNRYALLPGGTGAWLTADGRATAVRGLPAWCRLWGADEPGSVVRTAPPP